MLKRLFLPFLFLIISNINFAQNNGRSTSSLVDALDKKKEMASQSIVKNIRFKNIGPTVMSGRVVDLDVNPQNPLEFYVAYASGGLWHTTNNGTSFTPIMDSSDTQNIGDIAVHWPSGTIWVGTGECNASRSSYAGIGILKSTDQGESWQHMGLGDSHHISRIIINPQNPDELVVGVTGHLYSSNEERGVFRTEDGGKTWDRTLFINDQTGIIDLSIAPNNFSLQFATSWEKDRKAWNFLGHGSKSAIFKSTDGGKNWVKISNENSGFPTGDGVGRIGLAVYDENTIYAVHDNQFRREKKEDSPAAGDKLSKDDFKKMNMNEFQAIGDEDLTAFLKDNNFPEKYTANVVKEMVSTDKIEVADIGKYLDNANSALFELPVIGAEVYRSDDGGTSWTKMNESYIDDLYYSYGYYFGQIRVDPNNKDKIYLGGVPIIKSEDGGRTYSDISSENVHADHHALWINPANSDHMINGNDGGVNITYDGGANWIKNNSTMVGQFYAINVDYQEPYNVYGGLQDNGVWMGPHNARETTAWHQTGHYTWKSIMGGDGMQVQIDRTNPNIVYTGFQFGNYYRLDLIGDFHEKIQPRNDLGEPAFRFNWQTPIILSKHNQDIVYLGSNRLHRSMDQGKSWEEISGDLSKGAKEGNVAYGTITTVSESPFKFGLLYVGTDDGQVQRSLNSGQSWDLISANLPAGLWVSEVVASRQDENRVYVSLNGYRNDDFTSYLYISEDQGQTWQDISSNMPDSPINAIAEDQYNEDLLFVGTDIGLFVSFNRGNSWEVFQSGIPNVAIHDLVIQDEARHLVVGTHGRSIYQADITVLQKLNSSTLNSALHVFELPETKYSDKWGNPPSSWTKADTPGLDIVFYAKNSGEFNAEVKTVDGVVVSSASIGADSGLNILSYDMAFSKKGKTSYLKKYKRELKEAKNGKTYLPVGMYEVEISGNNLTEKVKFNIVE